MSGVLYGCRVCGLVSRSHLPFDDNPSCPRCATSLARHGSLSLQRTWALVLASVLLYVPANTMPIMSTRSVFGREQHTILGGIEELWTSGDWMLAVIVFTASLAVPILKIAALALLAATAQRRSQWRSLERARLFRLVQTVGHWSMLDVFVVVLLVGMIRFEPFAGVQPEPGLLAFGTVVVLTMLATESFDPRLLWPQNT